MTTRLSPGTLGDVLWGPRFNGHIQTVDKPALIQLAHQAVVVKVLRRVPPHFVRIVLFHRLQNPFVAGIRLTRNPSPRFVYRLGIRPIRDAVPLLEYPHNQLAVLMKQRDPLDSGL